MKSSERSLEIELLLMFKAYGEMSWTFVDDIEGGGSGVTKWRLGDGPIITAPEYRKLVKILKDQDLVKKYQRPAKTWLYAPTRKTITVYRLTDKGKGILEEMGL